MKYKALIVKRVELLLLHIRIKDSSIIKHKHWKQKDNHDVRFWNIIYLLHLVVVLETTFNSTSIWLFKRKVCNFKYERIFLIVNINLFLQNIDYNFNELNLFFTDIQFLKFLVILMHILEIRK